MALSLLNCTIEDHILEHIKSDSLNILTLGFNEKGYK